MGTQLFNGFTRLSNFPLDERSVFSSYQDAYNYAASDPTAYAGQIIAVVDEIAEEVSIYNLIFPSEVVDINFELQGIAGGTGTIRYINSLAPDEDGNIVITGTDITLSATDARTVAEVLAIFEGIGETEFEILFSKVIRTERVTGITEIIGPTDAVSREYLENVITTSQIGIRKTVQMILDNTGRNNIEEQ